MIFVGGCGGDPTYAYRIGHLVVNRDGTITVDEPCMIARIRPLLLERGYISEENHTEARIECPAPVARTGLRISAELACPTALQMCRLLQILCARQHIINRMLKTSQLFVEISYASSLEDACPDTMAEFLARFEAAVDNGQVSGISLSADAITLDFPLEYHNPDHIPVYNELLRRLVAMSHTIQRVNLEPRIICNNDLHIRFIASVADDLQLVGFFFLIQSIPSCASSLPTTRP